MGAALARGYGALAGFGFIGAAVLAVPSTLLLDPIPEPAAYGVTLAGVATGFALMALPWGRLDLRWLHLVALLATVQAAAAVAVFGQAYVAFFFLIAVGVAYVVPTPRELLAQFAAIGAALVAPVFYGPASPKETLQLALVVYPLLALTGGIFAYLRQRMVADRRSYALFAQETLALAQRIAGSPLPAVESDPAAQSRLPSWSRRGVSTRAAGILAAVFAAPLLTAGLAAAGMKLPPAADDAFARVGIDLPNQGPGADTAEASERVQDAGRDRDRPEDGRANDRVRSGPEGQGQRSRKGGGQRGRGGTASPGGEGPNRPHDGNGEVQRPAPEGTPDRPTRPSQPDPSGSRGGPLEQALDDTLGNIGGLLAPDGDGVKLPLPQ